MCLAVIANVDVDATNRKLIWENGKRLSIDASVRRTHREYSDVPLDLIETHLIRWLERELAPRELFQKADVRTGSADNGVDR